MAYHLVKLTRHGKQYRVTLPVELVKRAGLLDAEVLRLQWFAPNTILIEEYHGKEKEKRAVPEDKAGSDRQAAGYRKARDK